LKHRVTEAEWDILVHELYVKIDGGGQGGSKTRVGSISGETLGETGEALDEALDQRLLFRRDQYDARNPG
jgi:hypothetical protein